MEQFVIKRVEPQDRGIGEEWVRVTDEEPILGVSAWRSADAKSLWHVSISVAEFIRKEPLQSALHDAITQALGSVPGVAEAEQEDREVWIVTGDITGEDLIRAAAIALDGLADATRAAYAAL